MLKESTEVPFSVFLYAALIGHLVYGVPAMGAFLLFALMDAREVFVIFLLLAIVKIPLTTAMTWLIAKRASSNYE